MSKIRKIVLASMLLALYIILNRFISIKTEILVISFSFIPIMMSAIWLGPKYSTLIAALGDLLGAVFFPFGPYFPGFTLSCALSGLIYGLFLYNNGKDIGKKSFIIRLIISSIIQLVFVNIFVTSLWIHILYNKAYLPIMTSRVITQLIMIPIHVITIYELDKFTKPYINYKPLEENE